MRRTDKRLLQALFTLLFLSALWIAGLHAFTLEIMNAPKPPSDRQADAVIVLTGGSNRLEKGFRLLETGHGKKLFISGVYQGIDVRELLARTRRENKREMDCCVILGFAADNTVGNAQESVQWMRAEGYKSAYLVTSDYHMKRALLEFSRVSDGLEIIPHPVSPRGVDMKNWWRDTDFRDVLVREYSKYVAALLLGLAPGA